MGSEILPGTTAIGGFDDIVLGNASALARGSEAAGLEAIGIDTSILTAEEIAELALIFLV